MDFSRVTTPQRVSLLISFLDIQGFLGISQKLNDPLDLFALLDDLAKMIIHDVDASSGRVIKLIGDSALVVYPEEAIDRGVNALLALKTRLEEDLSRRGFSNRLRMTAHFGEAAIGLLGEGQCRHLDVLGDSVNTAAMLERTGHGGRLILSPQAFRRLSSSTRKLFHRFTPPQVYLAEER
ncbi:MAG TPA: adenylate/guanylate cyclase domain-containing protein [Spirochaetia bacterium]|nr:adenylate/guanylate cyclase domain-containing protein [Spirochaetia bacterium]